MYTSLSIVFCDYDKITTMDINTHIKDKLKQNAEDKYQKFAASLLPNVNNIIGVRLPILRKISKEILKLDWQTYINMKCEFMEETMLQGMIIAQLEDLNLVKDFIPKINNWSVCDSFCCSLKFTNKNKELIWQFLKKYVHSNKEYEIRFAFVMIINYFIEENYLQEIFEYLNNFNNKEYYAQMAAAWLISMCYIKYPQDTIKFLKTTALDNYTYNKAIQKIIESNKINKSTKNKIKLLKH